MQVLCEFYVSGDIGEHHIGGGHDNERADGQSVQAVGEIDGIGCAHDDENREKDIAPSQVRLHIFEKRHRYLGGKVRMGVEQHPADGCQNGLQQKFFPGAEPLAALLDLHQIVIGETDGAETHDDQQGDPDIEIGQVGPQQGRRHHRADNQHAPHGGGPRFFVVGFRPVLTDELPDLHLAQALDHPGTEEKTDDERRQAGVDRPKRNVAEDIERRDAGVQRIEEMVDHGSVIILRWFLLIRRPSPAGRRSPVPCACPGNPLPKPSRPGSAIE